MQTLNKIKENTMTNYKNIILGLCLICCVLILCTQLGFNTALSGVDKALDNLTTFADTINK